MRPLNNLGLGRFTGCGCSVSRATEGYSDISDVNTGASVLSSTSRGVLLFNTHPEKDSCGYEPHAFKQIADTRHTQACRLAADRRSARWPSGPKSPNPDREPRVNARAFKGMGITGFARTIRSIPPNKSSECLKIRYPRPHKLIVLRHTPVASPLRAQA